MRVVKYCCAGCASVIVQTTQSDVEPIDMADCQSCLGLSSCYLISDPFDVGDYYDELNLIREDVNRDFPSNLSVAATNLTTKDEDFRLAIDELKSWAEEQEKIAENKQRNAIGNDNYVCIVQRKILSDVIEHCEAALEENE